MLPKLFIMPTTRLPFLYPHLFRTLRLTESAPQCAKNPCCKPLNHRQNYAATFSTSARAREPVFKRHGKAVEPPTVPPNDAPKVAQPKSGVNEQKIASKEVSGEEPSETAAIKKTKSVKEDEPKKVETVPPETPKSSIPTPQPATAEETMQSSGPMEAVLHMPPPEEIVKTAHHLSRPPYVHHFDTYTLVKQLEAGGYTKAQAITCMKVVRALLNKNLNVAEADLINKSDVDNETYLFRAACSELSTEVKNNRRVTDEETRQQRTLLQHEVDILTQKLNQDLLTLKDDIRGIFDDRKMAVREEHMRMENAIQQSNLQISVKLNGDVKSDIEGLRWVLVRRSVIGILFMAVMTLGTIRYATYISHERKKEAERAALEAEKLKKNDGRVDNAPGAEAAEILAAN